MLFITKKDIPPGLITAVRKEKGSKKFIVLVALSALIVALGFVSVLLYNHYLMPELQRASQQTLPIATPQASVSQTQPFYAQSERPFSDTKPEAVKPSDQSRETKIAEIPKKVTKSKEKQKSMAKENLQSSTKKQSNKSAEIPFEQFNTETVKAADYLYRAQDFEARGNYSDAISEYREYLRITGKQEPKILDKIATLYLMIGDLKEASHYSQLSLNQAPDNVSIIINYGVIQAKTGNLTKAEECFRKVLSMNPENKTALYNLALLKEKKKQYEEALKLYERLYQLGDSQAAEAIQRVRLYK
ncbi:tetratricopeptide repeat protein [Thermodesulfovibrio sp. 3907-1M]|uniref:Tetratricopeptide repeat protein n=1 Tax=Thermodesulfovibrio autotrophicus TaxID=3118333 RepID=A0AAU8GYM3_9BACT